jgi:hypothetical protein
LPARNYLSLLYFARSLDHFATTKICRYRDRSRHWISQLMVMAERKEGMARSGWRVFANQCSCSRAIASSKDFRVLYFAMVMSQLARCGEVAIAGSPNCPN